MYLSISLLITFSRQIAMIERHVLDEVGAQQRREAAGVEAAQVQAADQALVAQQRHQRDACRPAGGCGKAVPWRP